MLSPTDCSDLTFGVPLLVLDGSCDGDLPTAPKLPGILAIPNANANDRANHVALHTANLPQERETQWPAWSPEGERRQSVSLEAGNF